MNGQFDGRSLVYVFDHLGKVARVTRNQWISVVGAAISGAIGALVLVPTRHPDWHLGLVAAGGTAITALVHLLQTIPDPLDPK